MTFKRRDVSVFPEEHPGVVITKEMMTAGLKAAEGCAGDYDQNLSDFEVEEIYVAMVRASGQ